MARMGSPRTESSGDPWSAAAVQLPNNDAANRAAREIAIAHTRIQRAAVDPDPRRQDQPVDRPAPVVSPDSSGRTFDLGPMVVGVDQARLGSLSELWVRDLLIPSDDVVEWLLQAHAVYLADGHEATPSRLIRCDLALVEDSTPSALSTDHLTSGGLYVHPEQRAWTQMVGCTFEKRYRARNNPDAYSSPPPGTTVVDVLGQPALCVQSPSVLFLDDGGWPAHFAPVTDGSSLARSATRMLGRPVDIQEFDERISGHWGDGWSIQKDELEAA